MSDYRHDEWCAYVLEDGDEQCDCVVKTLKAKDTRIEELEASLFVKELTVQKLKALVAKLRAHLGDADKPLNS